MLISLKDTTLQIGDKPCFEHTSWDIQKGQHWAITGFTGSGKSILAKAICRQITLIHGQILYYFDENHPSRGLPYFYPNEILVLSAETHHEFLRKYADYHQARWQSFEGEETPTVSSLLMAKSNEHPPLDEATPSTANEETFQRKIDQISKLFQLSDLLDRKILHLSHGESRKVFMARLLLHFPRLLILDDPYTGLDQEARKRLVKGIEGLIKQGVPQILFISSRVEDIPEGIDHLMVVKDNHVAAKGDREAILSEPGLKPVFLPLPHSRAGFQKNAAFGAMVEQYTTALKRNNVLNSTVFIHMENVSVTYDNVEVLKNINWTVLQGERWALQGRNGAGKTTLLSLILADNPQSYANEITLFGKRRGSGESIWDIKKNIGWVSPELHIYYPRTFSCRDVICSGYYDSAGLYRRCSPEQVASASGWIQAFGLGQWADMPFHNRSAGQQRLALLARALVKNPPILVLDEPCQALDDEHRQHFIELLDQLCAHTAITLIYVTHDQGEIPASITHHLKLDHGKIVQSGPEE